MFCAEGETRTLTMLPSTNFESAASTSSATPATGENCNRIGSLVNLKIKVCFCHYVNQ